MEQPLMVTTLEKEPKVNNIRVETPVVAVLPAPEAALTRRILIVEDNQVAGRQLQHLLQSDPQLEVDVTADGAAALQMLTDHSYSIVITDLRMPHMDGMQLIREVQERGLPVTVIVTTGHGGIDEA